MAYKIWPDRLVNILDPQSLICRSSLSIDRLSLHRDVLHQVELPRIGRQQELSGDRFVGALAKRASARIDRVIDRRQARFVLFDQRRIEAVALFGDCLIQQPDRLLIFAFGARDLPVHQFLIGQLARWGCAIDGGLRALRRQSAVVRLLSGPGDVDRRQRGRRYALLRRLGRSGFPSLISDLPIAVIPELQVYRGCGHRQGDEQRGESRLPQHRGREQPSKRPGARPPEKRLESGLQAAGVERPEGRTPGAYIDLRPLPGFAVDASADRIPHLGGRLDRGLLVKPPEDFILPFDLVAQGGADGAIREMRADLGGARTPEFVVKKIFKLIFATFAIHNRSAKTLAYTRRARYGAA